MSGDNFFPGTVTLQLKGGYAGYIDSGRDISGPNIGAETGYFISEEEGRDSYSSGFPVARGLHLSIEALTNPDQPQQYKFSLLA